MAGTVTIKDVAFHADVSVGTVSRVFNNHTNVTDEVRRRVLKAAADLGYFGAGTSGQDGRSHESARTLKEIGFLFCSPLDNDSGTNNPFWSYVLHGVESEARKSNIKVTYRFMSTLIRTPQLLLTTLYDMKLGGILLVGPADEETVRLVQSTNLPLVLLDNYVPDLPIDAVLCDNFQGARTAVDFLIKQGHRQIAFLSGPLIQEEGLRPVNRIYSLEQRALGYRTALLDAGLPIDYSLYEAGTLAPEGAYEACKRLLARNEQCSALFCCNDAIALGALKALREAGRRVPEDVSIVGFDDLDLVEHLTPPLTTVHIPKEAMGSTAVKQLLARAADMEATRITSLVDVTLIKRASVRSLTG